MLLSSRKMKLKVSIQPFTNHKTQTLARKFSIHILLCESKLVSKKPVFVNITFHVTKFKGSLF